MGQLHSRPLLIGLLEEVGVLFREQMWSFSLSSLSDIGLGSGGHGAHARTHSKQDVASPSIPRTDLI